ncbi:MAG TPA: hypothetical protein VGS41_09565 [Chthonomonadales bacterium]|nr:hypothetical protein [Chthonomonadales bacterium]
MAFPQGDGMNQSTPQGIDPASPQPDPQAAAGSPAASTQPAPAGGNAAVPNTSQGVLLDPERRKHLQSELIRLGVAPLEIQRLLSAEPAVGSSPAQSSGPRSATMAGLASELMARATAERARAVEAAATSLPEFREAGVAEARQAEQLLREAHALRRREKYAEAEARCRQALELTPKDAAALEMLGDILQGVAKVNEALAAYKRATQANPNRATAERKYGDLLMRQENWTGLNLESAAREPKRGVILSLIFPGAGQIHNGEYAKGIFFILAEAVCAYVALWSKWRVVLKAAHGALAPNVINSAAIVIGASIYIASLIDVLSVSRSSRKGGSAGWEV